MTTPMFRLTRRQAATLSTMTRVNTLIPGGGARLGAGAAQRPFSRLVAPNQTLLYRSRSAYGQTPWAAGARAPPTLRERFQLHECLRLGRRATFAALFRAQRRELRVTDLMADLFLQGPAFDPARFDAYALRERDATGKTALHYAVCGGAALGRPGCASRLVRPLLGGQDENGVSALMLAAERGDIDQVQLLMHEAGLQDRAGRTALMYALVARRAAAARLLWPREAHLRDAAGAGAREYAARYRAPAGDARAGGGARGPDQTVVEE